MAHGDTLFFVPLDCERIVDAVTGLVFDRKLPAADLALRTRAVAELRTFDPWLGAEGGRLRFGHVVQETYGASWSQAFDVGTGMLSAYLAVGEQANSLAGRGGSDRVVVNRGCPMIPVLRTGGTDDTVLAAAWWDGRARL